MLEPHLLQVDLELFGDQHRDGGVGALAHLDIGHGQDDLPVAADADEGVRREAVGVGRLGLAVGERQAAGSAAGRRRRPRRLQEAAPGEIGRRSDARRHGDAIERSWSASLRAAIARPA